MDTLTELRIQSEIIKFLWERYYNEDWNDEQYALDKGRCIGESQEIIKIIKKELEVS